MLVHTHRGMGGISGDTAQGETVSARYTTGPFTPVLATSVASSPATPVAKAGGHDGMYPSPSRRVMVVKGGHTNTGCASSYMVVTHTPNLFHALIVKKNTERKVASHVRPVRLCSESPPRVQCPRQPRQADRIAVPLTQLW